MTINQHAGRVRRARRHLPVAGFVLVYLAAGGVALALGDRVTLEGWLALHLVLLGAAGCGHQRHRGLERALRGRPSLAAAGAWVTGAVVLGHAASLAVRVGRALPARLADTVWFYLAAASPSWPAWVLACG